MASPQEYIRNENQESLVSQPDENGFFGPYGGRFVPPPLVGPLEVLTAAFLRHRDDEIFREELAREYQHYSGRPTPLYHAERLSEHLGATVLLKREDLNHLGAHKLNNCLGQALLARRMGKKKLIAETGAGQHGVATAAVAARLGLACDIYMGEEDMRRQRPNVTRIELMGARVVPATSGDQTLSAAVDEVPSAFLGAVELTPIEVAQIYQSLAAGGFSVPLRSVTAVQTAEGTTLNRYPLRLMPLPRRDAVAVLNYALTQVIEKGTARALPGLLGSNVTIAGKTGTTNERRDSWFVGYTRDRVAVSWVGKDDNSPAGVTGGNAAMRLWAELFKQLPIKPVNLDMPEGAYWTWVDPELNALSDKSCAGAEQLPFIEGTEPRSETPCLARLDRDDRKSLWRKFFDRD